MDANVNWGIAKIHLLSNKKQTAVATLGVTFGISMFILIVSFMKGTNEFLNNAMLSSTPDIHLYQDTKPGNLSITEQYYGNDNTLISVVGLGRTNLTKKLRNVNNIVSDIKQDRNVQAVSSILSSQVFFSYGNSHVNGIVDGVNIDEEKKVIGLSDKMIGGSLQDLVIAKKNILLGSGLAENLGIHIGDFVNILTPAGNFTRFKVGGIFQFGLGGVDNVKAFVNIADAQQIFGKDRSFVTDLHIKVKNLVTAKTEAAILARKFNYRADDWTVANASILATVVARNVLTYVVSIALLVVAGFGIYNIMNMSVMNKLKDISILKVEGFVSKDIRSIFLLQCVTIGLIGAILGICLGFVLSYVVSRVPFPKSDIVGLKYFPVLFEVKYYVFGLLFGVVSTVLAGLLPSIKASRSDPVTILRV